MKPIPYGRQHITDDDLRAVEQTLRGDYLTQGPAIAEFEKAFAAYIGSKYAVAVNNGTSALHLAALALGADAQSRVITSPITFSASANCIRYCGGTVDFCDIDPQTYLLDIEKVRAKLKAAPRGTYHGIIPVDLAGYPVQSDAFRELADEYGLWLLEDACHAPGASFVTAQGQTARSGDGRFAHASIFSFHPVKHIAMGEGGAITTNDELLYREMLLLRTHGITRDPAMLAENHGGWYMEMQELGYNYRLTDFQAALGTSQLARAEAGLQRRQEIALRYDAAFRNSPVRIPFRHSSASHAFHLYVIRTEKRKELYDHLKSKNIFAQVHYIPVHLMPYYRNLGWKPGDFPEAEKYYAECLSLPMYPSLTPEEQEYVIEQVLNFF